MPAPHPNYSLLGFRVSVGRPSYSTPAPACSRVRVHFIVVFTLRCSLRFQARAWVHAFACGSDLFGRRQDALGDINAVWGDPGHRSMLQQLPGCCASLVAPICFCVLPARFCASLLLQALSWCFCASLLLPRSASGGPACCLTPLVSFLGDTSGERGDPL